jgi:hypothetical protein
MRELFASLARKFSGVVSHFWPPIEPGDEDFA